MCFYIFNSAGKKPINLSVYSVQSTNIPPKETLTYSKQTQTNSSGGHERDGTYFCIFFYILKLFLTKISSNNFPFL